MYTAFDCYHSDRKSDVLPKFLNNLKPQIVPKVFNSVDALQLVYIIDTRLDCLLW